MALRMIWPLCSAGLDRSNELPSALVARPLSGATAWTAADLSPQQHGTYKVAIADLAISVLADRTWTALAGLSGAGLSAISVLLLVPSNPPLRRQRHQPLERSRSEPPMSEVATAPPQRDVRDPAPTVAVPYRIVQKPRANQQSTASVASTASRRSDPTPQSSEGWGDDPDLDW